MKLLTSVLAFSLSLGVAQAALNGPCTIPGVGPGTCLRTADCAAGGGGSFTGYCPRDPADVKCCFKRCPGANGTGRCRPIIDCVSGRTLTGYCPGPATVKCCMPLLLRKDDGASEELPLPEAEESE
ncbi:hypothetical protein CC1G_08310 [Coprinopsis cinerea okayama7|uniref:Uncharacterized protein n=1 Tax=Coprinopsis cinerea (strain Okayama-7 / 130 / ATCC MYA-4618 / FGSC 9003) TaxID=240176 RepID=A8PG79_COPC7|nr:hypothetical protein CC1G_08310 [Coprinopsis cinerea okayama7\|eukprot:XP_001841166.1 hypothetical protein CC1G_08310 [Coprinopsis cinerea okayama7\